MAIKGLTIPIVAKYTATNNTVTYSDGVIAGKAVEYSAEWTTSEASNFFADDGIAETESGDFQSGSLTLGTDDLDPAVSKLILGLKEVKFSYGESKEATELVRDNSMDTPFLGFGIIETHQKNNENFYRAVLLPKIKFSLPSDAATTKGESVEWQNPSITANIQKSDQADSNYDHPWHITADFDLQSEAIEYLKAKLNITDSPQGVTVSNEGEG